MGRLLESHPQLEVAIQRMSDAAFRMYATTLLRELVGTAGGAEALRSLIDEQNNGLAVDRILGERLLHDSRLLDDRYFDMQEAGRPAEEWSIPFRQARLTYAAALLVRGCERKDFERIVYEMAHSQEEPLAFIDRAELLAISR